MPDQTIVLPPTPSGNGHDGAYRLTVLAPKRHYLSYLRERWWVVMVALALTVSGVLVFEAVRTETYNSYAQIYVTTGAQVGVSVFSDVKDDFATLIELLKGSRLRNAAMEELGPRAALLKSPVDIEVVRPMSTSILQLRATSTDPALSQAFLQALINKFLAFKTETRASTAEDLVGSLNEQLAKREEELKTNQEIWVEFQKTNTLAVLEEEAKSASLYLAELNVKLAQLRIEEDLLKKGLSPAAASRLAETRVSSATTNQTAADVERAAGTNAPAFVPSDNALRIAQVDLAVAMAERAKLVSQFSEMHPSVRALTATIERLTNTIVVLERQDTEQKQLELADTQKRIATIEAAIPSVKQRILQGSELLSDSQRYRNDLQRQQSRYDTLLGMMQNVDLGKNMSQERITVLDTPSPGRPAQRNLPLRICLAIVLGGFLSLGITFVWHLMDDRFVSLRDVKDNFGEPVLGLVPQIKIARAKPREALLKDRDPRGAYAESYRHLRSALLLSTFSGSRPHTLLFTGAAPTEGKSTIAANVAAVLARSGLRVVLVDADLHTAGLGHLLQATDKAGVLDFIRGETPVSAILHETEIPGLTLVPVGTHSEHVEGMFLRPELGNLFKELKAESDFIIIDGAPILGADDAALLVPHADTVVVVVRPFFSRSRSVRQALEMLYQRQAKQVAIILNRARRDDLAGHYAQNQLPKARNGERSITA